jgi:hypothetical protein
MSAIHRRRFMFEGISPIDVNLKEHDGDAAYRNLLEALAGG